MQIALLAVDSHSIRFAQFLKKLPQFTKFLEITFKYHPKDTVDICCMQVICSSYKLSHGRGNCWRPRWLNLRSQFRDVTPRTYHHRTYNPVNYSCGTNHFMTCISTLQLKYHPCRLARCCIYMIYAFGSI